VPEPNIDSQDVAMAQDLLVDAWSTKAKLSRRTSEPAQKVEVRWRPKNDDEEFEQKESVGTLFQEEIAGRQAKLAPLSWLEAANIPGCAPNLMVSFSEGESAQVLPEETLLNLGKFDFQNIHRAEEQRLSLHGKLILLQTPQGEPVHLCATVTVGLIGEHPCFLEVVISTCCMVLNHLPVAVTVWPHCWRQSDPGSSRKHAVDLQPGESVKMDLAMDAMSVKVFMQTEEEGHPVPDTAHFEVKSKSPFQEASEQMLITKVVEEPHVSVKSSSSRSLQDIKGELSSKLVGAPNKDKAIGLHVTFSSAFDMDSLLLDTEDPWLETVSWFHPAEWRTYRRGITLSAGVWVENHASTDIWLRAGGAHGAAKMSKKELKVPKCQRQILPYHLCTTRKIRIGVEERAARKYTKGIYWKDESQLIVKFLNCRKGKSSKQVLLSALHAL